MLEIIIDLLDSVIPDNAFREKKSLHPKARLKETILLYDHILANGLDLGAIKLRFERKLFNWKAKGFNYGKIISLSPPSLVFGNNGICKLYNKFSDPDIKNAMFKFGHLPVKIP